MNYNNNNNVELWQNARKHYASLPNGGPVFRVYDGLIHNGVESLARCNNDTDAIAMLLGAGFSGNSKAGFKA